MSGVLDDFKKEMQSSVSAETLKYLRAIDADATAKEARAASPEGQAEQLNGWWETLKTEWELERRRQAESLDPKAMWDPFAEPEAEKEEAAAVAQEARAAEQPRAAEHPLALPLTDEERAALDPDFKKPPEPGAEAAPAQEARDQPAAASRADPVEAADFGSGKLGDEPELSQGHPSEPQSNLGGAGDFRLPEPEGEKEEAQKDAGPESMLGLLRRIAEAAEELVRQGLERELRGAEGKAPDTSGIRPLAPDGGFGAWGDRERERYQANSPSVRGQKPLRPGYRDGE